MYYKRFYLNKTVPWRCAESDKSYAVHKCSACYLESVNILHFSDFIIVSNFQATANVINKPFCLHPFLHQYHYHNLKPKRETE